jgi:hypothetical protein
MRRILALALLAASPLTVAGAALAQPLALSPGQADRVTAGSVFDATGFATSLARQGVVPYANLHIVSPEDGNRTEHNFWASALRETPASQLRKFVASANTTIRPHPDNWEYGETVVVRPSIPAFRGR